MGEARELLDARWREDDKLAERRRRDEAQRAALDAPNRCRNCGCEVEPAPDSVIKRGAVSVLRDPLRVTWRGRHVPLSPTEAVIVELVVRRGRASHEAIEEAMRDFGSRPETRSVLLWRIRHKFAVLGAAHPFEAVGQVGLRFVPEPDETGSSATTIGLRASTSAARGRAAIR